MGICALGRLWLRGDLACRMLDQKGCDCVHCFGGYRLQSGGLRPHGGGAGLPYGLERPGTGRRCHFPAPWAVLPEYRTE